ncbi:MAG TPA: hypothetical protein ENH35_01425 [Candidatus Moranbacteria bacterium]|nr:hypothetical protein [Candidatus Campbellbacteria bacterium]HDH07579.1 hypothetical protein [Candidatus Moranbacteria bacterium]HDZ85195.1 hypothetical protein [Candidatus Moranbacteria bacterium]
MAKDKECCGECVFLKGENPSPKKIIECGNCEILQTLVLPRFCALREDPHRLEICKSTTEKGDIAKCFDCWGAFFRRDPVEA